MAAVLVTAYYAIKVVFFISGNKQKYSKNANCWGANVLRVFGINVDVKGLNHLTPGKTYILASNHSSLLDIPVMFSTFREHNYIIIYKTELEKIPLFGKSLKVSPFVSIDRSDARNAMASIEKTLEQMKGKDCPIIFPEGTRSEDGKLQSFKRGAFLLASRSKKPIVPIAIIGTSDIVRKGTLDVKSRGKVKVIINPPIENSTDMDRVAEKALMEKVHNIIKESIDNNS
ncbi:lysophospholipid acyltransferase family protein [Bacteroidota bacterium]